MSVSKIVVHPAYKEHIGTGDIALLKLGECKCFQWALYTFTPVERVDMTMFAPVCLPKRTDTFENKDGWVNGKPV